MQTTKRCISLLLAAIMVLGMIPASAWVASAKALTQEDIFPPAVRTPEPELIVPMGTTEDGFEYEVYSDHIEIIDYMGNATELVVPAEIEGRPVTIIGMSAFSECSNLTSVTLLDGVTTIEWDAFENCSKLKSINIPNSVCRIYSNAFENCSSLVSVNLPESLTIMGSNLFQGCSSLKSINIPSGIKSIAEYTFMDCRSLTSVNIPNSVTYIGHDAFKNCSSLTDITLPDGLKSVLESVFYGCSSLKGINIPSNVTLIERCAFHSCSNLTSITIPEGVTEIDVEAFVYCSSLANIHVVAENAEYYSTDGILYDKTTKDLLICPAGKSGSLEIPSGVSYIGYRSFMGCEKLTSVTIPDGVTTIGTEAFYRCTGLKSVSIPESVTGICDVAFGQCNNLTDVYYGGSKSDWNELVSHMDTGNKALVNATIHYAKPDIHDTIEHLTEVDYWVLSHIAYWDFDKYLGKTIKEALTDMGKWEKTFKDTDMKYSELCGAIGHWKVVDVDNYSDANGFYGVTFANGDDAVIAYRGSIPLTSLDATLTKDAYYDWVLNDLYPILTNRIISQGEYKSAIVMYENAKKVYSNIAVTGHSLGGGLADIISAHYGCKGVSMNAISILDTFYAKMPEMFGSSFAGVDKWNFVDHANHHDLLAGSFEVFFSYLGATKLKPVITHASNDGDFKTTNLIYYHGLESYITQNADGDPALTHITDAFTPKSTISNHMTSTGTSIDLGTSGNNFINKGLSIAAARVSYGGNGHDTISTNVWNDTIIGGRGSDDLDGSWGNDTYYYYKGDDVDIIHDIGGNDKVVLLGFDEDDTFSVVEEPSSDYICITNGGKDIVRISKKNREYVLFTTNRFKIVLDHGNDSQTEVFDITDAFDECKSGQHLYIGCPVHVEILDPNGNVVHTLTDGEVGTWYTEYGNFYVFEEENGEYGKVLDLVEGHTARIVGADEGTMDVTYQVPVDGELSEPVSVSGVPVTENLSATIEETEDGDVYLVIDEDSDGETDSERKLYGECPFTDVPEGSFYYEPVMWAVENGITSGTSETTFDPSGLCLRAHVVTFLYRAAGSPAPASTKNPFTDVKSGDFYYNPVLWAVANGITQGVSKTQFGSTQVCNRAAVVTFLWRTAGSPEPESTSNPFVDVKTTDFFYKPVLWAVENGITNGVDATHFGPATDCNRAQVVTFLYRAAKINNEKPVTPTEPEIDPGLVYVVYDDHVEITNYTGTATEIGIPARIEGLPVTVIGEDAFNRCYDLINVSIPEGVTTIGDFAFQFCSNLTTISIPDTLVTIGDSAFDSCYKLTDITLPAGISHIGGSAFVNCDSLISISIPEGITAISDFTFYACDNLTSVLIPESVTSIGYRAFFYCDSLTAISIPEGVISIGNEAFARCYHLNTINFDGNAPVFGENVFDDVTGTAYYPANNFTWTTDVMQDYGGDITWVANDSGQKLV